MILIAICDDNPLHLEHAEKLTREVLAREKTAFHIRLFSDAGQLMNAMDEEEFQPDIAVLDIEMDGEDGISLAKDLNALVPGCRIIFLTGYIDYAPDAYTAEHIWFVLKSRASEHFALAMQKALSSLKEQSAASPGFLVREDGRTVFVPLDEILYLSRISRKAFIHCLNRDYTDSRRPALLIPEQLKTHFLQCHQGYWVNLSKIRELDGHEFVLTDGTRIPISRGFRDNAREAFFDTFLSI